MKKLGLILGCTGVIMLCTMGIAEDTDKVSLLRKELAACKARIARLEKTAPAETLEFRTMVASLENFWDDRDKWEQRLNLWAEEGFNSVMWYGQHELLAGHRTHVLLPLKEFPEAHETSKEQIEKNIARMRWLMGQTKKRGLKNYLYTHAIVFTEAFAKAHGLDDFQMPVSPTVHISHANSPIHTWTMNSGVRNELTRRYMEAAFVEFAQVYKDLDGFLACMSESVPGRASSYFPEVVVPAMKKIDRPIHVIAVHWQMPLQDFIEDIVPTKTELPGGLWLGLHAYNSEQPTDAKPYPFVIEWAERTGLPTVASLYIANVLNFPFNSPKFAYEFTREMKRIPNFKGYYYWEFTRSKLSPLFRKALARYSKTNEPYSDEPWLDILEEKYGDRQAAEHFLKAYDISGRIILEKDALIWCAQDVYPRELRVSYKFMTGGWLPSSWQTSRVRGQPLQPIWNYARWVARDSKQYRDNNGSDWRRNVEGAYDNYRQISIWRTEGGSNYDIIPPAHMAKIRQMGQQCLRQAELGLQTVKKNRQEAETVVHWMKAYQLLSSYYEKKVLAAIAALIYADEHGSKDIPPVVGGAGPVEHHPVTADSHMPQDRIEAERLADEALACYEEFVVYAKKYINPILIDLRGTGMSTYDVTLQGTAGLDELMTLERDERAHLAKIFKWPK